MASGWLTKELSRFEGRKMKASLEADHQMFVFVNSAILFHRKFEINSHKER